MTIPVKIRNVMRTGACYPEEIAAQLPDISRRLVMKALRRMNVTGAVVKRNDGRVLLSEWAKDEQSFYGVVAARRNEGGMRKPRERQPVVIDEAALFQKASSVNAALVAWR